MKTDPPVGGQICVHVAPAPLPLGPYHLLSPHLCRFSELVRIQTMAIDTFTEGKIPFDAPNAAGQPAETWYKVW